MKRWPFLSDRAATAAPPTAPLRMRCAVPGCDAVASWCPVLAVPCGERGVSLGVPRPRCSEHAVVAGFGTLFGVITPREAVGARLALQVQGFTPGPIGAWSVYFERINVEG